MKKIKSFSHYWLVLYKVMIFNKFSVLDYQKTLLTCSYIAHAREIRIIGLRFTIQMHLMFINLVFIVVTMQPCHYTDILHIL